jgi:hypothetical protein
MTNYKAYAKDKAATYSGDSKKIVEAISQLSGVEGTTTRISCIWRAKKS